jgi:hypothetical protein
MKTNLFALLRNTAIAAVFTTPAFAQVQFSGDLPNMRSYDQTGINVFEDPKNNDAQFDGLKLRFGAGFTQSFQGLKHETTSTVPLFKLTEGFNTASANLYIDALLADGIRLNVTSYLSSRHHNETWVKGGFIQFDKLPFKGKIWDDIMKVTTIKIGHTEINYGDQHFRRSDGGNTIYNPFVENYIMDGFATEIGGEVYVKQNNFIFMVGASNGMINGNVAEVVANGTSVLEGNDKKSPSVYGKIAYDKQLEQGLRLRLAGSVYHNGNSGRNTLYAGDRTGSNYFMVMDPATIAGGAAATYANSYTSGRFNPNFSNKITAAQFNAFLKYEGAEVFGTYEIANGRSAAETEERDATQIAIEGVYRIGAKENVFLGARYNTVKAELAGVANDVNIDRVSIGAGWFLTKNILLKGEYVNQKYKDFVPADVRSGGKFNGYVIQAVVGF